jgi:hypothetical protein
MPLAAYSTGMTDEREDEAVPEAPRLSQQDAMALIMGAAPVEDEAAKAKPGRKRPKLGRPSLPRPSLPRLPGVRAGRSDATPEPAMASGPAYAAAPAFAPAAAMPAAHPAPPPATPAARPGMTRDPGPGRAAANAGLAAQPAAAAPGRLGGLRLDDLSAMLRDPRKAARDPRILAGGVVAVGVVLLGLSLLGGGGNPAGGPGAGASASAPAGAGAASAAPGVATLQLTGKVEGTYTLAGSAGFGRPGNGQLASTWADATGTTLALTGRTASGTRTTAAELVLVVTVLVNGAPVTFTSDEGDCTIGMAEKVFTVQGSFVCPEVASDDGKVKLKITGTYQT